MSHARDVSRARVYGAAGVGILAIAVGIALRLRPFFGNGPLSPLGPQVAFSSLGVTVAALLSAWLVRPRRVSAIEIGPLLLAGALAIAMAAIATVAEDSRATLLPASVECAGAFVVLLAASRLANARLRESFPSSMPDAERRVHLAHARNGRAAGIRVAAITPGDEFHLEPGDDIPSDGIIIGGGGFVDESSVVGPSLPVAKRTGDRVLAGTVSSIPGLIVRATKSLDRSFIAHRERRTRVVAEALLRPSRIAVLGVAIASLGVLAALIALGVHLPPESKNHWLPIAAGAILASSIAAPAITVSRSRLALLRLVHAHGLFVRRARDLIALPTRSRWQVDPRLLAAPGRVEAVALADVGPDYLLAVADALLSDEDGPDAGSVRATLRAKNIPPLAVAALRASDGLRYATIDGARWFLGPERALYEVEHVELDASMAATIDFLRERHPITWLVGRTPDGIVGAVGVAIDVAPTIAAFAREMGATLMPGLSDPVRNAIAKKSEIGGDGPPVGRRGATLLGADSPRPSHGLRIRVFSAERFVDEMEREGSSLLAEGAVAGFPALLSRVRPIAREHRGPWIAGAIVPGLSVLALGAFGWLGPLAGLAVSLALLAHAMREPSVRTKRRAATKQAAPELMD